MSELPYQPLGEIVANWREPPFPAREVMHGRFCRLEPLCRVTPSLRATKRWR